jgi:predicted GNAT family N-acyltransferase
MRADAPTGFTVRLGEWPRDEHALRAIRLAVFVIEQNVPEELEWDGIDAACVHAIAEDAHGAPIGCGRLLPDGHIGRMAVNRDWRGRGVGTALLERLVQLARAKGHPRVLLHAQTHAIAFYARAGFEPVGIDYLEAGIPHRTMQRVL